MAKAKPHIVIRPKEMGEYSLDGYKPGRKRMNVFPIFLSTRYGVELLAAYDNWFTTNQVRYGKWYDYAKKKMEDSNGAIRDFLMSCEPIRIEVTNMGEEHKIYVVLVEDQNDRVRHCGDVFAIHPIAAYTSKESAIKRMQKEYEKRMSEFVKKDGDTIAITSQDFKVCVKETVLLGIGKYAAHPNKDK